MNANAATQPDAAWTPSPEYIATTNIAWLMTQTGVETYEALHAWSVENRECFWGLVIERLGVRFYETYSRIMAGSTTDPKWLPGARLNIVESCFMAPGDSTAIIYQAEGDELATLSVDALRTMTDRVAANLVRSGFVVGDAVAIYMPMTIESVAIYLGIIKAGCVVVGIADSFRPKEISTRLRIANAKAIFTQEVILRAGKALPMYANVQEAGPVMVIVIPAGNANFPLRSGDVAWADFLQETGPFEAVSRAPHDPANILFSSGTTGDPKAIPWSHATPLKCAMDAHFHQNIHTGDVVVWPTNIGWMMGPWLIFASLMNRATMGLYYGAPTGRAFGQFVQDSKTNMLGVVPSLVRAWKNSDCMQGLDWSTMKVFSSTGECSSAAEMQWLMEMAGGRPVIEYCGGTEIGGGYITGTVTRPCIPGTFNTPALGLDFVILNEEGAPAKNGELFLIPPSIGLSTELLNKDHATVYYQDTPSGPGGQALRRHGDQMEKLPGQYWQGHGRADDTMNLGGIKISSAEIETVLATIPGLMETAAIAVSPSGGPSQLVIYAVCKAGETADKAAIHSAMQAAIKRDLNPLFKIHDVVLVDSLPRTASNKVMRRVIRDQYE